MSAKRQINKFSFTSYAKTWELKKREESGWKKFAKTNKQRIDECWIIKFMKNDRNRDLIAGRYEKCVTHARLKTNLTELSIDIRSEFKLASRKSKQIHRLAFEYFSYFNLGSWHKNWRPKNVLISQWTDKSGRDGFKSFDT